MARWLAELPLVISASPYPGFLKDCKGFERVGKRTDAPLSLTSVCVADGARLVQRLYTHLPKRADDKLVSCVRPAQPQFTRR